MHLDFGGEKVVHDGESDVLLVALVAIHPEKFWQQRPRILKQEYPGSALYLLYRRDIVIGNKVS